MRPSLRRVANFDLLRCLETGAGIRVDDAGDVILAGLTSSSMNEPVAIQDVYTAKLAGSDGRVEWVSQIGTTTCLLYGLGINSAENVRAFDLGPRGTIVVTGYAGGSLAEPSNGGVVNGADVFVMRLNHDGSL